MTFRTTTRSVAFARPFTLDGIAESQPAGIYVIETDEELIDGVSMLAYRRTGTRIRLHEDRLRPGIVETVTIDPAAVEAALADIPT